MTSEFLENDPKDHYRVFKHKNGWQVLKVVAQGGVVALISTDIHVTTLRALKGRIKGRILHRNRSSLAEADEESKPEQP